MNETRRWILLVVILAGLLALGVIFRAFLISNVIMPVSLVIWAVFRVFLSIDQEVYWVALIFIAFVFGLSLLPVRASPIKKSDSLDARQPAKRLEYWQKIIQKASESTEDRIVLKNNLHDLVINVIAVEEQMQPNAIRNALKNKELELPEEIYEFLESRKTEKKGHFKLPGHLARKLASGEKNLFTKTSNNSQPILGLLEFLENYAEIHNDEERYN